MARRVTHSAGAALFLYEPADPTMVGESRRERALGRLVRIALDQDADLGTVPDVLDSRGARVLAWESYRRDLPQMFPSTHSAPYQLQSTWNVPPASAAFEIAVPIPVGPGGGARSQGVIVLCRHGHGALEPYGNYELALLRNVALRVALVRNAVMTTELGALIAETARAFATAEPLSPLVPARQDTLVPRPAAKVAEEVP
jgi:hypothetical protein